MWGRQPPCCGSRSPWSRGVRCGLPRWWRRARPAGAGGCHGARGRSNLRKRGSELTINSTVASAASTPAPGVPGRGSRVCAFEGRWLFPGRAAGQGRPLPKPAELRGRGAPSAGRLRRGERCVWQQSPPPYLAVGGCRSGASGWVPALRLPLPLPSPAGGFALTPAQKPARCREPLMQPGSGRSPVVPPGETLWVAKSSTKTASKR